MLIGAQFLITFLSKLKVLCVIYPTYPVLYPVLILNPLPPSIHKLAHFELLGVISTTVDFDVTSRNDPCAELLGDTRE